MSDIPVKDPYIRVLLNRREEIRKEVNKLQSEYQAIGELILRNHNKNNKNLERDER